MVFGQFFQGKIGLRSSSRRAAHSPVRPLFLKNDSKDGNMKCNHCLVEFHSEEDQIYIGDDKDDSWFILKYDCPACGRFNLFLANAEEYKFHMSSKSTLISVKSKKLIRPKGINRPPPPTDVPQALSEDYIEACLVLPDSPKASAALSRRCLQNLLRDTAGVEPNNLYNEIQSVIDSGVLPSHLIEVIDAIRNIGNFAAHPMKSKNTELILPVEPEEAEWNLDVLESLFDFYFVQPAIVDAKKAALNKKLTDAGKPPMR